jgi:hypothetical protein
VSVHTGDGLTIGRILIAAGVPKVGNNGSDVAPAVVTHVWPDYVNARVLLDGHEVAWWTSVPVYGDKAAYDDAAGTWTEKYPDGGSLKALYWPTRA